MRSYFYSFLKIGVNNMEKILILIFVILIQEKYLIAGNMPENLSVETKTDSVKITILYDNYVYSPSTKSDWGFSCLIEGTEKTILFDTGMKGELLLNNVDKLNADLTKADILFLSHIHLDHTGGIDSVVSRITDLQACIPKSFPDDFEKRTGLKVVNRIDKPVEICKEVFSTGEMGNQIKEQSLIINTEKGLVVITGCAHQGIIELLKKAKEILGKDIYLVIGGFHLLQDSETMTEEIINEFKKLGVKKCGATHCTGEKQIQMFKDAFGEDYINIGTGKILILKENGIDY
jgi:7,8-dihydropterin-6-yl-methyl-4-(beta-D-ribofuranosyl)aminobenzene 5'-phosphate synthase